jgi:hypothetical protein
MTQASFRKIVEALNGAGVRYMVVGGIAVIAHGYVRLTVDVDLLIQLNGANIVRALDSLAGLGYRPGEPKPVSDLWADCTVGGIGAGDVARGGEVEFCGKDCVVGGGASVGVGISGITAEGRVADDFSGWSGGVVMGRFSWGRGFR